MNEVETYRILFPFAFICAMYILGLWYVLLKPYLIRKRFLRDKNE